MIALQPEECPGLLGRDRPPKRAPLADESIAGSDLWAAIADIPDVRSRQLPL